MSENKDFAFKITCDDDVEPEDFASDTDSQKIIQRVDEIINDPMAEWSDDKITLDRLNVGLDVIERQIDSWPPNESAQLYVTDSVGRWTVEITRVS